MAALNNNNMFFSNMRLLILTEPVKYNNIEKKCLYCCVTTLHHNYLYTIFKRSDFLNYNFNLSSYSTYPNTIHFLITCSVQVKLYPGKNKGIKV